MPRATGGMQRDEWTRKLLDTAVVVQLASLLRLRAVRLYITTQSVTSSAGNPRFRWHDNKNMATFWEEFMVEFRRAPGKTDLFDYTFANNEIQTYENFEKAKTGAFQFGTSGAEVWRIEKYVMIGRFEQYAWTIPPPKMASTGQRTQAKLAWKWVDLGWRLMAVRDDALVLDLARIPGGINFCGHSIALNGTF